MSSQSVELCVVYLDLEVQWTECELKQDIANVTWTIRVPNTIWSLSKVIK